MSAAETPDASPPIPPVLLTGFLNSPLGLGQVGRALAKALNQADLVFEAYDQPLRHLQRIGNIQTIDSRHAREFPICLCSINGEHFPSLAGKVGNRFFQNRYIIGIWFWETAKLPVEACRGMPYVDEVWTCSEFTANAIREADPNKLVSVFPYPLALPPPALRPPAIAENFPRIGDERFVYLFAFDYNSCLRRKNPEAVCQAFCKAFPDPVPGGPICLIKSINGDQWPVEQEQLRGHYRNRKDIVFFDGFLGEGAMDALLHRANCYISLHRAEGFGLTILEAMARGKPCIASSYSGNLTFMTPENSWLVPVSMRQVGGGSKLYPAEDLWADPDVDAAARAMRECLQMGLEGRSKIEAARRLVEETYSLPKAAAAIRKLLEQAAARTPAPKKDLPSTKSSYARAKEQIQTLKDFEQSVASLRPALWTPNTGKTLDCIKRLARESRKTGEMILKAARDREELLVRRIAALENEVADTRRRLAELLRHIDPLP